MGPIYATSSSTKAIGNSIGSWPPALPRARKRLCKPFDSPRERHPGSRFFQRSKKMDQIFLSTIHQMNTVLKSGIIPGSRLWGAHFALFSSPLFHSPQHQVISFFFQKWLSIELWFLANGLCVTHRAVRAIRGGNMWQNQCYCKIYEKGKQCDTKWLDDEQTSSFSSSPARQSSVAWATLHRPPPNWIVHRNRNAWGSAWHSDWWWDSRVRWQGKILSLPLNKAPETFEALQLLSP